MRVILGAVILIGFLWYIGLCAMPAAPKPQPTPPQGGGGGAPPDEEEKSQLME